MPLGEMTRPRPEGWGGSDITTGLHVIIPVSEPTERTTLGTNPQAKGGLPGTVTCPCRLWGDMSTKGEAGHVGGCRGVVGNLCFSLAVLW